MVVPNISLVTDMFDSVEKQLEHANVLEQCYIIVNVLIREPALYQLSESTLGDLTFETHFDTLSHMSQWIKDITPFLYQRRSFGDTTLLQLPNRYTRSLDTFNVDMRYIRVGSFDCIDSLRNSLTQLHIAMLSCVQQRSYYERMLNHYLRDVFLYLNNYIKVIENEQREPEEHVKRTRQTDDHDHQLPSEVISSRSV